MAADDDAGAWRSPGSGPLSPTSRIRKGMVSRLWRGLFGDGNHDFEKMLHQLSTQEASVTARLQRRSKSFSTNTRNLIYLTIALEVVTVSYAIMTTREIDLSWKSRAVRVLPMFLLPALSTVIYYALVSLTRIFNSRDHQTLDKIRAAKKAEIDELKERTKYYTTQQLIQKYDIDPAAKAAAATVLASKLGSDSGLKVYVGDESNSNGSPCKSHNREMENSPGLRQRKQLPARGNKIETSSPQLVAGTTDECSVDNEQSEMPGQRVEHPKSSHSNDGGWLARIAALLVGEDPAQCYALICRHCYMHNGLVRKEDFDYVTYYCPHCHSLNNSRNSEGHEIGPDSEKGNPPSMDANRSYHEVHKTISHTGNTVVSSITDASVLPEKQAKQELDKLAS